MELSYDGGIERVGADAFVTITGLGTSTGLIIQALAEAQSFTIAGPSHQFETSAIARASLDFFALSDGPERPGFATFLFNSDKESGGGGSDFVAALGSCQFANCTSRGTLVPFELGVPFEIGLSASAGGIGQGGGYGFARIQLQLFESDGTPVSIFNSDVPEPGTWVFSALGLIALWARRTKAIS